MQEWLPKFPARRPRRPLRTFLLGGRPRRPLRTFLLGARPRRPLRTFLLGARPRRPLRTVVLGMIIALALPASALAHPGFTITVRIANHTPVVNKRWPIELIVTKGKKRLNGKVRYQFLFAGVVVRTQPRRGAFAFKDGVYRDQLVFPRQALGERLSLRFLVTTKFGTEHVDWALRARRPRRTSH